MQNESFPLCLQAETHSDGGEGITQGHRQGIVCSAFTNVTFSFNFVCFITYREDFLQWHPASHSNKGQLPPLLATEQLHHSSWGLSYSRAHQHFLLMEENSVSIDLHIFCTGKTQSFSLKQSFNLVCFYSVSEKKKSARDEIVPLVSSVN